MAALAGPPTPARHALLVGANQGGPTQPHLRYAEHDAASMRDVLVQLGGVAPDRARLLTGPTQAAFRAALADLARDLEASGPTSSAIVYYSGHSDREGLRLGSETYTYDRLRDDLGELDARLVLTVIDGCSSGAMVRAKGGTVVPAFMERSSVEGRAFLTSSAADEVSQEADHIGASYFTHALLSGLRGAADFDGDGRVMLREVHAFAADETLARTVRTKLGAQHPTYDLQLTGIGDFVVTEVADLHTRLELSEPLRGRVYLRDADGHLRAELQKVPGRRVELGLPAGRYTIVVDDQGSLSEGRLRLGEAERVVLEPAHLVPVAGEVTLARGQLYARVPVALTLTPYPTSAGLDARDQLHHVSLGVLAVFAARLQGFGAGGIATAYFDGAEGVQVATGFNLAGAASRGVQIAAGLNVADRLHGLQLATVNVANRNRGVQLGLVNLEARNEGLSVALVHVSRRSSGMVLALLPLVGDGIHEVELWTSTQVPLNLGVRLGTRVFFTEYGVAWDPVRTRGLYSLGLGGRIRPSERVAVDVSLAFGLGGFPDDTVFAPSLRGTVAHRLVGGLSAFAGLGLGLEVALEGDGRASWVRPIALGTVAVAPQASVGVRFGRVTPR